MLRFALRALTLMRLAGTFGAVKRQVSDAVSEFAAVAALYGAAALIGIIGAVFVLIAFFLALATVWPAHWAALFVGVLLLVISGVVLFVARHPPRRTRSRRRDLVLPPGESPGWGQYIKPAEIWARRHPGLLAAGAVGIGLLLGLSRGRSSDD